MQKIFTQEFKAEAVKLCLEPDANRREISDNLGIHYQTLCKWISASMKKPQPISNKSDYKNEYQKLISENAELKKKLKKAETEREILKKAAAYFASQNM